MNQHRRLTCPLRLTAKYDFFLKVLFSTTYTVIFWLIYLNYVSLVCWWADKIIEHHPFHNQRRMGPSFPIILYLLQNLRLGSLFSSCNNSCSCSVLSLQINSLPCFGSINTHFSLRVLWRVILNKMSHESHLPSTLPQILHDSHGCFSLNTVSQWAVGNVLGSWKEEKRSCAALSTEGCIENNPLGYMKKIFFVPLIKLKNL